MRLRAILPDLWEIVRPLRGQLFIGVVLIIIARCASLILPASTKYLIDDIIGKRNHDMLMPLVAAVVSATIIQAACSFTVSQILSKTAQRVISDMRRKIQVHIGRLPVAYFDKNKTGELVSRIMYDVEGLRNLVGTGLVEFAGEAKGVAGEVGHFGLVWRSPIREIHDRTRSPNGARSQKGSP